MVSDDPVDEDFCKGFDREFFVVGYEVRVLGESVDYHEDGVVAISRWFLDGSWKFCNKIHGDFVPGLFWRVNKLDVTIFGVAFGLVLLTLQALFDVFRDLLSYLWERKFPLDEFDRFGYARVTFGGVVVVLLNAFLFLVWSYLEFPLEYWEFFIRVSKDSQDITKVFNVSTKASVFVGFEYAVLDCFLPIHVIASPAECIGSAVVASWGVADLEFVLSEEFRPSDLSSCQLLRGCEVSQVFVVREDDQSRCSLRVYSPVHKRGNYGKQFLVMNVVVQFRGSHFS